MSGLVVGQVPSVGTLDVSAFAKWAKTRVAEVFPCGEVTVDGDDVGFWVAFASAAGEERWEVYVAWRQPPDEDDVPEDGPRPSDTPRALSFVTADNDIAGQVAGAVEDGSDCVDASFPALVLAMRCLMECLDDDGYEPDGDLLRMLWLLAGLPAGWSDPTRFLARPGRHPEALDRDGTYAEEARKVALAHFRTEVGAFLDTLDPQAFEILLDRADASRADWPEVSSLVDDDAWKGLDSTFVDGAPLRAALEAHPGLMDLLCQAWGVDEGMFPRSGAPDAASVLRVVTGKPVSRIPVAAALARMEASGWQAPARSGTWATPAALPFRLPARKEWAWPATAAMSALAGYPDDTVPRSDVAWTAFDDVWPTLALADAMLRVDIDPARFAGLHASGGWEAVRSALAEAVGEGSVAWNAVIAVGGMVDAFRDQVLLPARVLSGPGLARPAMDASVAHGAATALARHILVDGRTLADMLCDHRAWCAVEVAYPGNPGAYEAVLEAWRPVLPVTYRDMGMAGFAEIMEGAVQERGGVPPTAGERVKGFGAALAASPFVGLFRKR